MSLQIYNKTLNEYKFALGTKTAQHADLQA